MPTGNLPAEGKKLWERVYEDAKNSSTCKDAGDRKEECAARVAWKAVANAGWKKDADGNWHKSEIFNEFSLRIERASYDKATGIRRWRAVASDTDEDSREDNMSLELFEDFMQRIATKEPVPEEFRSDFWSGGMPYLSVSHYPDFNGDAVPGDVQVIYVDGTYLKAKGTFHDTPLGRKCFEAICSDLYSENSDASKDKVRISIAFLDWQHKHKSTGWIFTRGKDADGELCPECIREMITGEGGGKVFLKGHLVHLAMTRVPVNKRTDMEVDKSMADIKTRKDDAASIVGDELAEDLEEKAKLVGKSETLVIKSDSDAEDATPLMEQAKKTKEVPMTDDEECEGEDCEEVKEGCGKKKEKSEVTSEVSGINKEELVSIIKSTISESIQLVVNPVDPVVDSHPLDKAFELFRSEFDKLETVDGEDNRLMAIQTPFNVLGQSIVDIIKSTAKKTEVAPAAPSDDLAASISRAITDAMQPFAQKLELVSAQLQSGTSDRIPQRRSINASELPQNPQPVVKSQTPKLRAVIERTT